MASEGYKVGAFERKEYHGPFGGPSRGFWEVGVEAEPEGLSLSFSRFDDEKAWMCDFAMRIDNGYPMWAHGSGSRCCLKKSAAGDLEIAINAAFLRQAQVAQFDGKVGGA